MTELPAGDDPPNPFVRLDIDALYETVEEAWRTIFDPEEKRHHRVKFARDGRAGLRDAAESHIPPGTPDRDARIDAVVEATAAALDADDARPPEGV